MKDPIGYIEIQRFLLAMTCVSVRSLGSTLLGVLGRGGHLLRRSVQRDAPLAERLSTRKALHSQPVLVRAYSSTPQAPRLQEGQAER